MLVGLKIISNSERLLCADTVEKLQAFRPDKTIYVLSFLFVNLHLNLNRYLL